MLSKKRKLISLIIIVILTFIIGMRYEIDYRVLTRKTVKYLANYELGFYGGKGLRIFETEIAFILTLIPIGFYWTARKLNSLKDFLFLLLIYLILTPLFYLLYCFIESIYLNIIITQPKMDGEIIKFHYDNVNYKMILGLTIFSTFFGGIILNKYKDKLKKERILND